ncbi:hypothetical protein EsH8_IX_000628 [Colletotrichum jinshuiense]
MLERTAATLESCTSRHALPSATRSLRSRRKLHTGFWQHGAAAIDISDFGLGACPNESDLPVSNSPSAPSETLTASTFLLDFLYPSGTAAFLRRAAPGLPDHHSSSLQRLPRRSRPFTSSTVATPTQTSHSDTPELISCSSGPQLMQQDQHAHEIRLEDGPHMVREDSLEAQNEPDTVQEDLDATEEDLDTAGEEDDVTGSRDTHSGPSFAGAGSRPELMRELMAATDTEYFGSIWQLYSQLEPGLQAEFRPEVIEYLYRSANVIDARRVIILFSQVDDSQWTPEVLTSAVTAHLRLGQESEALKLYYKGLDEKSMVGGLDELLHYAFKKADWGTVKHVWSAYHTLFISHRIMVGQLERLAAVPDLGKLAIEFANEVKGEEDENAQKMDVLVKKVARRALQQPCKPQEALPLLKIVDQVKWYNIYLCEALARGQRECLPEIYRVYRSFPNIRPYWEVLHGMFDVFYPDDVVGLEQVYEDYHTSYGQLDQWGFRKFLKFYASRGDIKSLERLWGHYVKSYKHRKVLQEPETYNHVLNAYANVGDFRGARRIFDDMKRKFGVTPSIHSWNILLKSCLPSTSYDRARLVFEELCGAIHPDSISFATIMSMAASKGDLEYTLDLYQQAKSMQVQPDVPILHAVVRAYCQNGGFKEALATCIEAQVKKVPGEQAKLWDTLLRHHAERRAFDDVCRAVTIMAQHNVEWTSETHEVLLQALVLCRQTHKAFSLLRLAHRDKTFTLTPEHFTSVIDGTLRNRELGTATRMRKLFSETGLPVSIDIRFTQLDAMIRRQLFAHRKKIPEDAGVREQVMSYIRALADDVKTDAQQAPDPGNDMQKSLRRADSLHQLRRTLSKAIELFIRYRDFDSVREIQRLHSSIGPKDIAKDIDVSIIWVHSLMKGNIQEKKYDAAKANWELIWQKTLGLARPASYKGSHAILPRYRYALSKPVWSMTKMLLEQQDPKGIKTLVDQVLGAGFLLDMTEMNHMCQVLAQMGYWSDACELCEKYLMPNWTGWRNIRMKTKLKWNLPLEERRMGKAPRFLRPTSYTLAVLAKDYRDLRRMAPWSSAAAKRAAALKIRCPRVVYAFRNLVYSGVGIEKEIFDQQQETTKGLDKKELPGEQRESFLSRNDNSNENAKAGRQPESAPSSRTRNDSK